MENSHGFVSLIVPCYNEGTRLQTEEFRTFVEFNPDVHILFVDDGSQDNTLAVLETIRTGHETAISILPCERNGGKGEAVRLGILHALDHLAPRIVGFWDADLATPLTTVAPFCKILDERPDIEMIFGARVKLLGREVNRRTIRHYPGRAFATVVSSLLRLSIYDTQCGAKLFRTTPNTRTIFAEPFISKWVFDVEIIARYMSLLKRPHAVMEGTIYEYPLEKWTDVAGSKVRFSDFFTALVDVWHIYHRYL